MMRITTVFMLCLALIAPASGSVDPEEASWPPRMSSVRSPFRSQSDPASRPALRVDFHVDPVTIRPGEFAHLVWRVDNAVRVFLDDIQVAPYGDIPVSPAANTEYRLDVHTATGKVSYFARLNVIQPSPRPVAYLSLRPEIIERGSEATLAWSSEYADRAWLDGETVTVSGIRVVLPSGSRQFVLKVEGPGGVATRAVPIIVKEPPPPPPPPSLPTALFEYRSDRIDAAAAEAIAFVARTMAAHPLRSIAVVGHADARGDNARNRDLGRRRAEAVREFLVRNGVAADRILIDSRGEEEPAAPNETGRGRDNPEGRRLNRRVEFRWRD